MLTDAAKQRTGIERFEFLEDGSIFFVDRNCVIPRQSYAGVTVNLQVGNDVGNVTGALTEKPPGSGRWKLDK